MWALVILLAAVVGILYVVAQPFVLVPVYARELTPKIISINDVHTDSLVFIPSGSESLYRGQDVTVLVEVTSNHHTPVAGATVTIYGCGDAAAGTTDEQGSATVHLHIKPIGIQSTPRNYLSLGVVKDGYDYFVDSHAIKIIYL